MWKAYAYRNPAVGYCQGMNFIGAGLLRYLNCEDTFWTMCGIVEILLQGHHDKNMIGGRVDTRILLDLVRDRFPELVVHLNKIDFELSLVTSQWFIPMFLHGKILHWNMCTHTSDSHSLQTQHYQWRWSLVYGPLYSRSCPWGTRKVLFRFYFPRVLRCSIAKCMTFWTLQTQVIF
jgi:hypothetical protein